jgi:hypothetical protein
MLGLLVQISGELSARGVAHALVGAGALAAHGVSRSTFGLDLFTTDRSVLAPAWWAAERARGVHVEVRIGDDADPLAGVVRLAAAGQRDVDVVVGRHAWQRGVVHRAEPLTLAGRTVPVATPADLVLLKLYAGGAQDAWDVEQLLAAARDVAALCREVESRLGDLPAGAVALWREIAARRR